MAAHAEHPLRELPVGEAVEACLERDFDAMAFRGRHVVVAVPDLTRPVVYESLVRPLLERLVAARAHVTVAVALGLHRALTEAEFAPLAEMAKSLGLRCLQHDPLAPDFVELSHDVGLRLGGAREGLPALPARYAAHVAEADLLICVGVVEPHQYAGFSGGVKTLAIGCAPAATIAAMHGLEYLRDPHTRLGQLEQNPFAEALWRLTALLPPIWAMQVVPASEQACFGAWFGPVRKVFGEAVDVSRAHHFRPLPHPAPWMHLKIPPSKASNFYQASRGATYVALAAGCALEPGGTVVIEAACPEGMGEGLGEQAFARALTRGLAPLQAELHAPGSRGLSGGEQRAYVLAMALERCRIALVGAAQSMPELQAVGIDQFPDVGTARTALALTEEGLVIKDVFHRVPVCFT